MIHLQTSLQEITTGNSLLHLYVPEPVSVRQYYKEHSADFPYWSQIWPSAIGLCEFLSRHTGLIKDKTVIELAAGLGLPSLFAAQYSESVVMSDYLPEAIQVMQQTIDHHHLENLHCRLLDWNEIPPSVKADVLLLSDVNYEPAVFDKVFEAITRFLNEGSLVILSTPQRLMAKPFIERLLSFTHQQEEISVERNGLPVPVSVLVLKQHDPVS